MNDTFPSHLRGHHDFGFYLAVFYFCLMPTLSAGNASDELIHGRQIYKSQCAECHGAKGKGVVGVHENPLHGTKSLKELIDYINESMPEAEPELCRGEDAADVARYIFESFYSIEARAENEPARVELARLTVRQYENTLADLLASFIGQASVGDERGVSGEYFSGRRFNRRERALQRVDPQVSFDFEANKPDPKIKKSDEFSIRWQGAVIAEETGDYEFFLKTENGARLWVNDNDQALIDAWVSSKGRATEHSGTIRLIGGRPYPIKLDMFKYKDKSASISLEWKPPRGARQVIPTRNLSPNRVPVTFVTSASFPPDDSVSGYVRGTSVSKAWDRATTAGAVEAATVIVTHLDRFSGSKAGEKDRRERVKRFCHQFAERAFRRPLSAELERFFVDVHFEQASSVEAAVKRSVMLLLKSPRFLYPSLGSEKPDDYTIASRLSYGLWDSIPDRQLYEAAAAERLQSREQVAAQARRMLADPRAKAKLRGFFRHWLQLDEKEGIVKDANLFPDFDEELLADLRVSLDKFLEDIVWSGRSDFRQILLADYLYLNERLAEFYGVELPTGTGFRKVTFEPDHRAGVVTHPYMLSALAYHNLSSPIHRGVFLTRRVLGRTLKPPPQATEFKDGDFEPGMTTREKVALITEPAACQSCHSVINPLGFSLEKFDAVGRFREREAGKPIDVVATYTPPSGEPIQLAGARDLARHAAESPQAHGAFVDQIFHHVVKQPINAYGPTARNDLIESFQSADFSIQKLLAEIAMVSALPGVEQNGGDQHVAKE